MFSSELFLTQVCFAGNDGDLATVLVDDSSFLRRNEASFGISNTLGAGTCDGIQLQDLACVAYSSRLCVSSLGAATSLFSEFSSCLQTFTSLEASLTSSDTVGVVEVCPGSEIILSSSLRILRSGTTLQCGADGSRMNGCVIRGGGRQIEILDSVIDVVVQGLAFKGATDSSVFLNSGAPLQVQFLDCSWEVGVAMQCHNDTLLTFLFCQGNYRRQCFRGGVQRPSNECANRDPNSFSCGRRCFQRCNL